MDCKTNTLISSDYIDRLLDQEQTSEYESHLEDCFHCRRHLVEMTRVALALKHAARPAVPRELRGNVMGTVRQLAAGKRTFGKAAGEWVARLNPHILSYTAGAVVSAFLFAGTLAGFRPLPVINRPSPEFAELALHQRQEGFQVITATDREYQVYNGFPLVPPSGETGVSWELPRLDMTSSFVGFSYRAFGQSGEDSAATLVEVDNAGGARIVDVLSEPKNPNLIRELDWTLRRRAFKPAKNTVSGEPVPTRIVMLNYRMVITG
jgi:hypothetical protein